MAPEQAAADPQIDHRADRYAVGVLGYEMLTGAPPPAAGAAPPPTAIGQPALCRRIARASFDPRMMGDGLSFLDNQAPSDVVVLLLDTSRPRTAR